MDRIHAFIQRRKISAHRYDIDPPCGPSPDDAIGVELDGQADGELVVTAIVIDDDPDADPYTPDDYGGDVDGDGYRITYTAHELIRAQTDRGLTLKIVITWTTEAT